MEAKIDASGTLTIRAETGLEHYALRKWWDDWQKRASVLNIAIDQSDGSIRFYGVRPPEAE